MNNQQLQTTEDTQQSAALFSIIEAAASNKDVDVEKMRALLDMQERVIDKNAEAAFYADFVSMQSEGLRIVKTKRNDQTNSNYATLDNIQDALIPLAGANGFAITFGEGEMPEPEWVRITADLIHKGGHSKHYHYDSPYDGKGIKGSVNKTITHAKASAVTYGQRYLISMIFNVSLIQDDDGNAANSTPRITVDQATQIKDLIADNGINTAELLKFLKAESVDLIPEQAYQMTIGAINNKIESNKQSGIA